MNIRKVAVSGAGQMGSGIAQVFAAHGFSTVIYDVVPLQLDKSRALTERLLTRAVDKGKSTAEERAATLRNLTWTPDLSVISEADLVIEAIVERLDTKQQAWKQVDELCRPTAIFASNTSSLPITQLAASISHPERFIGMHFMNPVPVMQLVEVIRGLLTSDDTHQIVMETAQALGKTPVTVNDAPGFISNRVLLPLINEAIFCLQEGIATKEDIDMVMKLGMNHPMGPLALADFIGLDTCLYILEVLQRDLGEDKYRPAMLLRKMVQGGLLGKKVGRGFYDYAPGLVAAR
ncbi:MAG: 3-hydroxybutyryl-CoA dehydrogenase [Cyanobacteria bacterium NC_groundwater_1444_Ag_S-0.65um_54_12]|nr:3-hydroxybutyryl-CoA dehydrogenase [Cyanobacteria bacterium NC_groundwater_1444_Ag_S-0.65um_54_12]